MADKNFDQYEYVAVIIPGATLLLGLSIEWPQYLHMASENKELSLGELGLFLVAAFIAGQMLQSVGDLLEPLLWAPAGGLPTDWVRKPDRLISPGQRTQLQTRVRTLIAQDDFNLDTVDTGKWFSITRQIYGKINAAKLADRLDAFNRTYGLMRGFAIALIVLAIVFFTFDNARQYLGFGALALAILALIRFYLFGKIYGRELFAQFLILPA
jgi:hypothetical protein